MSNLSRNEIGKMTDPKHWHTETLATGTDVRTDEFMRKPRDFKICQPEEPTTVREAPESNKPRNLTPKMSISR